MVLLHYILYLINLPCLKILHFNKHLDFVRWTLSEGPIKDYVCINNMHISESEERLYINTMIYELVISFSDCYDILFHSIDINQLCPYSSNWKQFVFTYLERFIFTGKSLKQLNINYILLDSLSYILFQSLSVCNKFNTH